MDLNMLSIDKIGLSTRAMNALHRSKVHVVGDMLKLTEDQLYKVRNLGGKTVSEIMEKIKELQNADFSNDSLDSDHQKVENDFGEVQASDSGTDVEMPRLSILEMVQMPKYRELILANIRRKDIPIENMNLSVRATNRLGSKGYHKMSDLILASHDDLMEIRSLGAKSVKEIEDAVQEFLLENEKRLLSDFSSDEEDTVDYDELPKMILSLYRENPFKGYSLKEMEDALQLPETLDEVRMKKIIGTLLAQGRLEYVDYRCYRVYESFFDALQRCDKVSERDKEIIEKRLDGSTLETISGDYNLTRERVRQLINKTVRQVIAFHNKSKGNEVFDEDYYRYFYETYEIDRKEAVKWLGIPEYVFRFFDLTDVKKGKTKLVKSLEDTAELDAGIRLKIRNYLNLHKLFINGVWIDKSRADLERVAVRELCKDQISFPDFVERYNEYLIEKGINDENLLITDAVYRTRLNKMSEARDTLWSRHDKLRYYDIDGQDFGELFKELELEQLENIEISTWKLFNEHTDIMEQYDIRDYYELHNLLRKTVPAGSFHNFQCGRSPHIKFGVFDRDEAIRSIIAEHGPVSTTALCNLLRDTFGYEPAVSQANYLDAASKYYNNNVYFIKQRDMSAENKALLRNALTEDYYRLSDVREIYSNVVEHAEPAEVNANTLKEIGFTLTSGYVLRSSILPKEYLLQIIYEEGELDLSRIKSLFPNGSTAYQAVRSMQSNYELIEIEPDRYTSIRKLEEQGFNREDLVEYCNDVWNTVSDKEYFNVAYLRQKGFESRLDDLLFSDTFYNGILKLDKRFSAGSIFGTVIFRRGKVTVTPRTLIEDLVREEGCIDLPDLISILNDEYGCTVKDAEDILSKLTDTDMYYDQSSDRLYQTVEAYYQELDEAEGK